MISSGFYSVVFVDPYKLASSNDRQSTAKLMRIIQKGPSLIHALNLASPPYSGYGVSFDNWGFGLLHCACYVGSAEMVEMLLQAGADVNKVTADGKYPLGLACVRNYESETDEELLQITEIIRLLISYGADVNKSDCRDNISSVYTALHARRPRTVALLASLGAEVSLACSDGNTPLHEACNNNAKYSARLLVEHGADLNAANREGETPLHRAIFCDHRNIALFLVANGADCEKRNLQHKIAFDRYDCSRESDQAVYRQHSERFFSETATTVADRTDTNTACESPGTDQATDTSVPPSRISIGDGPDSPGPSAAAATSPLHAVAERRIPRKVILPGDVFPEHTTTSNSWDTATDGH